MCDFLLITNGVGFRLDNVDENLSISEIKQVASNFTYVDDTTMLICLDDADRMNYQNIHSDFKINR